MKVITLSAEQEVQLATLRNRIRELKDEIKAREKERDNLSIQMTDILHEIAGLDRKTEYDNMSDRCSYRSPELSEDGKFVAVVTRRMAH